VSAETDGVKTFSPARVSIAFTVETSDGNSVPGLSASQFEILEDDKPVSAFESQRTIQPRGERSRLYSLLLLDLSGSILKSGQFPQLQAAASAYVDRVLAQKDDGHRVAVAGFDGRAALIPVADFSNDADALKTAIARLADSQCTDSTQCAAFVDHRTCAGWLCVDESTNLNGAVVLGIQRLASALDAETDITIKDGSLVLFTDGTDQAARVTDSDAQDAAQRSTQHVFAVGLGGEVDSAALQSIAKDGYEPVAEASKLQEAFQRIADRVTGLANRFYVLDYCSPKRDGEHDLTLRATWTSPEGEVLTGSLTRSFDATGFASGCELPGTP
jgi:VWFA-related protein